MALARPANSTARVPRLLWEAHGSGSRLRAGARLSKPTLHCPVWPARRHFSTTTEPPPPLGWPCLSASSAVLWSRRQIALSHRGCKSAATIPDDALRKILQLPVSRCKPSWLQTAAGQWAPVRLGSRVDGSSLAELRPSISTCMRRLVSPSRNGLTFSLALLYTRSKRVLPTLLLRVRNMLRAPAVWDVKQTANNAIAHVRCQMPMSRHAACVLFAVYRDRSRSHLHQRRCSAMCFSALPLSQRH
jgi:hypothetical protein